MISHLQDNYSRINEQIAAACARVGRSVEEIRLITVTKTFPAEVLQEVLDAGHYDIGENKVQEIVEKVPKLTGKKTVHLIGHLQTNKVTKVIPLIDWIHSIDSERLLSKIEHQCEKMNKTINVLVQVNTSYEETKSGCRPQEALALCEAVAKSKYLTFRGLMTIGLLEGTEKEVRRCFSLLRSIGEKCSHLVEENVELSMGMSGDFQIAIEEGATMIRLGTILLGNRTY